MFGIFKKATEALSNFVWGKPDEEENTSNQNHNTSSTSSTTSTLHTPSRNSAPHSNLRQTRFTIPTPSNNRMNTENVVDEDEQLNIALALSIQDNQSSSTQNRSADKMSVLNNILKIIEVCGVDLSLADSLISGYDDFYQSCPNSVHNLKALTADKFLQSFTELEPELQEVIKKSMTSCLSSMSLTYTNKFHYFGNMLHHENLKEFALMAVQQITDEEPSHTGKNSVDTNMDNVNNNPALKKSKTNEGAPLVTKPSNTQNDATSTTTTTTTISTKETTTVTELPATNKADVSILSPLNSNPISSGITSNNTATQQGEIQQPNILNPNANKEKVLPDAQMARFTNILRLGMGVTVNTGDFLKILAEHSEERRAPLLMGYQKSTKEYTVESFRQYLEAQKMEIGTTTTSSTEPKVGDKRKRLQD